MMKKSINKTIRFSSLTIGFMAIFTVILFSYSPSATANDFVCTGTHNGATFFDNIVVPEGETCTLNMSDVIGNIQVSVGASLFILPDSSVTGNIQANGADVVCISDQQVSPCQTAPPPTLPPPKSRGITIGGDVEINDTNEFTLIGNPSGVTVISGNVQVKNTQSVEITDFDGIAGNVKVEDSTTVSVTGNTIDGNLELISNVNCSESGNTVDGNNPGCT